MANKLMLVVEGDHNDADYIVSITETTEEELKKFAPLIKAIKNFKPYKGKSEGGLEWNHDHNWGIGDYCYRPDLGAKSIVEYYTEQGISQELIEEFDENYVPHENGNIHTIDAIFTVVYSKDLFRRR